MREIYPPGSIEFIGRDRIQAPAGRNVVRQHLLDPHLKGLSIALPAAEDAVKNLGSRLILVIRHQDGVAALPQVVGGCPGRRLERRDGFLFLVAPPGAGHLLILKDQEKASGHRLPGTKLPDKL